MTDSTITIKGKKYELQPLTTGQIRRDGGKKLADIDHVNAQMNAGELATFEAIQQIAGDCCDLIQMSVNNGRTPDLAITIETVESLSFGDMQAALIKLIEVTGLKPGETAPQKTASR